MPKFKLMTVFLPIGALLALTAGSAVAAEATASPPPSQGLSATAMPAPAEASKNLKRWGLTLGLSFNSSLHEWSHPDHSASLYLTTSPSWKWSDAFSTKLTLITVQSLDGEIDYKVYKSSLGTAWAGVPLNPFLKFSVAQSFGLPLSKDRRERESYLTGFSLAPTLSADFSEAGLPWLSAQYYIQGARLIHTYKESTNGQPNTQYSLVNDVAIGIQLSEKLSFTSEYAATASWTYAGSQKNQFAWGQSLSYQVAEKVSVSAGFGTSGSTLKDDGLTSAVSIFDANSTSVSVGVDVTL